jgi:hypothetical protein
MRALTSLAAIAVLALTAACARDDEHKAQGDLKQVGHDAAANFHKLAAEAKIEAHKLAADTRGAAHDVTRHDHTDDHDRTDDHNS